MAVTCTIMTGKLMMEKINNVFCFPFNLLQDNIYRFTVKYGEEKVKVEILDRDSQLLTWTYLKNLDGGFVNFNQFVKLIKEYVYLPDLFSLVVAVPSQGVVSCQVGIFPRKMDY